MCILEGGPYPIIFKGVTAPWPNIFFEKYFVLNTLGILMKLGTKKDHIK
jgi:hypothetical protein